MTIRSNVQTSAIDRGLALYSQQVWRFPMLAPQEEYMLAKSWREHGDRDAAHRSHLKYPRLLSHMIVWSSNMLPKRALTNERCRGEAIIAAVNS